MIGPVTSKKYQALKPPWQTGHEHDWFENMSDNMAGYAWKMEEEAQQMRNLTL